MTWEEPKKVAQDLERWRFVFKALCSGEKEGGISQVRVASSVVKKSKKEKKLCISLLLRTAFVVWSSILFYKQLFLARLCSSVAMESQAWKIINGTSFSVTHPYSIYKIEHHPRQ